MTIFINPHYTIGSVNLEDSFEEIFKEVKNATQAENIESGQTTLEKFISLINWFRKIRTIY
ncbi:MAG: hypothetical protein COX34_00970 [Candidatus Nealsonbacteria bacterium CG23_combo_of_CG06-09_8_20_14_all_36_12]|uniref:Uncharacterized protein n=1 Tax=Candidatus Nealsonbacteria bacterium CG23_combo_of_CG06-09_8_20_14_all_36_12 TaxID=1974718 RepID=A0A2G9Z0L3_9BACT|nr:MAG: hypothetical protein COX34_00970 [Candidatus Nealsonbacteria bacterium CG23_combo_of_CG06-09_8_20_14_all_36_12]